MQFLHLEKSDHSNLGKIMRLDDITEVNVSTESAKLNELVGLRNKLQRQIMEGRTDTFGYQLLMIEHKIANGQRRLNNQMYLAKELVRGVVNVDDDGFKVKKHGHPLIYSSEPFSLRKAQLVLREGNTKERSNPKWRQQNLLTVDVAHIGPAHRKAYVRSTFPDLSEAAE